MSAEALEGRFATSVLPINNTAGGGGGEKKNPPLSLVVSYYADQRANLLNVLPKHFGFRCFGKCLKKKSSRFNYCILVIFNYIPIDLGTG
jgi:hypothetical protein